MLPLRAKVSEKESAPVCLFFLFAAIRSDAKSVYFTEVEDVEDQSLGSLATNEADPDAHQISKRRKLAQAPVEVQDQSAVLSEGRLRQRKGAEPDQTMSQANNTLEANRSEGDGATTTMPPVQEQNAEDAIASRDIDVSERRTIVPRVEMWRRTLLHEEVEAAPGPPRPPVFMRPPPVFTKPPQDPEDVQPHQASSSSQRIPEPQPEPDSESERSSSPYIYRRPLVILPLFEESISTALRARADTPSSLMAPMSGQTSAARAFQEEQQKYLEEHPSLIFSDDHFPSPSPQKPFTSFAGEPQPLDRSHAEPPNETVAAFSDQNDDTPVEKPGPHECGTGPKAIRYVMRQLVPIMNEQVQMQAELDLMKEQIEQAQEDVREAAKDIQECVLIRVHAEDLVRRMKADRTLFDGTAQSERREEWLEFLKRNTIP